jgi:hypothetical protein
MVLRKAVLGIFIVLFVSVNVWALPQTPTFDIQKELDLYGNLDQDDIPGIGNIACGPAAAINSFVYLENKYSNYFGGRNSIIPRQSQDLDNDGDVDYYDDLISAAQVISGSNYMNTGSNPNSGLNGTWDDMMIYGKYQYLNDNTAKEIDYGAQLSSAWNWAGNRPDGEKPMVEKPGWISDNTTPTWDFLYNELVACEDVEILINYTSGEEGGHFLTLSSFHWTDEDIDQIIDQGEATIDYIDPATGAWGESPIWHSGGSLVGTYANSSFEITMAVKESIPEPMTVAILGLGALFLRKKQ